MTTQTDIANMALAVLDEAPIDSIEDDNRAARLCKLHFELTREAELSRHAWAFAVKTAEIPGVDTGSEEGTLNWSYALPSDCLRVLRLTWDDERFGIPISWEQRDGLLFSDQASPRKIRYIANLTDPDDWSALFTEVLVAALAIKMAHAITHKANMVQIAQQAYERALSGAMRVDAIERGGLMHYGDWSLHRGDTRYWRP